MDITEDLSELTSLPNGKRSVSKATLYLRDCSFKQLCDHYIDYFNSPDGARQYPPLHDNRVARNSFKSRLKVLKYDRNRDKLFHKYCDKDTNQGNYID